MLARVDVATQQVKKVLRYMLVCKMFGMCFLEITLKAQKTLNDEVLQDYKSKLGDGGKVCPKDGVHP